MSNKLSSLLSSTARRYAPALITTILLAGFFFYYFNVIIANNEAELKERKFRGLYRMATNLTKKLEDYRDRNVAHFLSMSSRGMSAKRSFEEKEYGLKNDSFAAAARPDSILLFRHPADSRRLYFGDSTGRAASVLMKNFFHPIFRRDLFTSYSLSLDDSLLYDELNITNEKYSQRYLPKGVTDSIIEGNVKQSGQIINLEIGGKHYKLFVVPFTVKGKYRFQLGGYLPIEQYEAERKSIPTYAILWLVIGIVIVILMIPLLKIFMMHPSEQLLTKNAAGALASLHVLSAVIILAALNTYVYFTVVRQATEDKLKILAQDIDSSFREEVKTVLVEISQVQNAIKDDSMLSDLAYDSNRMVFVIPPGMTADSANRYVKPSGAYPYFKHIIWVDSEGMQKFRWTTDSNPSRKINIKERDYFKAVKNKDLWPDESGKGFYLASISSWVADRNLAMIATPVNDSLKSKLKNQNLLMAGLSASLRSVYDTELPYGFGFCITKNDGEVLFHLDENRNLNENVVKECRDNLKLIALLENRSSGFLGCRSSGTHLRFYTMPIEGTPFSIITFKDMKLTWSEDLDVISASSVLVLMNLAVILFAMIIIRIGSLSSAQLSTRGFLFSWLRPDNHLKKEYISLCFYYLGAIVLILVMTVIYSLPDQFAMVGTALSYSYVLLATSYHRLTIKTNRPEIGLGNSRSALLALGVVYLAGVAIFSINLNSGHAFYLLSQLALIGFYVFMTFVPVTRIRSLIRFNLRMGRSFAWWYILFVYFFIVASSVVPLVIFYAICYKEERTMALKYTQHEFAGKIMKSPGRLIRLSGDTMRLTYEFPYHYNSFAKRVDYLYEPVPFVLGSNKFSSFYKVIKPSFSGYSTKMELLETDDNKLSPFSWQKSKEGLQHEFVYKRTSAPENNKAIWGIKFIADKNTILLTPKENLTSRLSSFIVFVFCLIGILWFLYFILSALIKRIFFKGFVESLPSEITGINIKDIVPSEGNIFLYGPAGTGKFSTIKAYSAATGSKMIDLDLSRLVDKEPINMLRHLRAQIEETGLSREKIILVVQNIESHAGDFMITEKKLELIEGLLGTKSRIAILCSRSFDALPIRYYFIGKPDFKDYTNQWSNILNSFYTIYHKWHKSMDSKHAEFASNAVSSLSEKVLRKVPAVLNEKLRPIVMEQSENLVKNIATECAHSDFLWSLFEPLLQQLMMIELGQLSIVQNSTNASLVKKAIRRQVDMMFEITCLKLESLAQNYYLSVWESLSREEQRTLYDISLDELVNPANRNFATRLEELGLVRRTEYLACYYPMNRSFRNFILDRVTKHEITSFQDEVAQKGFWRSFQLPLLIVIVAVGLFLFFTQRDAFDNLIAYLGAAVAGVAGLLRLLAMIPSSKTT